MTDEEWEKYVDSLLPPDVLNQKRVNEARKSATRGADYEVTDFDKKVRTAGPALGLSRAKELYIHSSRVPLDKVDLDKGSDQPDLFGDMADECEGMCGV